MFFVKMPEVVILCQSAQKSDNNNRKNVYYNPVQKLSRQTRKTVFCDSHKQCKTLFKDHMVRLKIISLYVYKDLSLRILGLMSHVTIITRMATQCPVLGVFWFRSCFSALWPEIKHFRIHKKCYFPVNFVASSIIFVHDCRKSYKK